MKVFLFRDFVVLFLAFSAPSFAFAGSKSKRAAYDLPAGAQLLIGGFQTTFACSNNGFYADQDNSCQIFHVCHSVVHPDGTSEMLQWSFLCGNQTVFNQFSFTCTYPEDSVPCGSARDFWYLNANLGAGPNVPFHNDQDVSRAAAVTPGRAASLSRVSDLERSTWPSYPLSPATPPPIIPRPPIILPYNFE